jgi:hypothetical protein
VGEDVGDDAVLARVDGQPRGLPRAPRAAQVVEQRGVVNGAQRRVVVWPRRDEPRARRGKLRADALGALGHLGARRTDADPDLTARVVQAVLVAPDDGHRQGHGRECIRPWVFGATGLRSL